MLKFSARNRRMCYEKLIMTEDEAEKTDAQRARLHALTAQALTNIEKAQSETARINNRNQWLQLAIGAGATLVILAIAKLLL